MSLRAIHLDWLSHRQVGSLTFLARSRSYAESCSWLERIEFCGILTIPSPPVLEYFSTLPAICLPDADAIWLVTALEIFTTALMRFHFAYEGGVVWFQCYALQMGQEGCIVLVSFLNVACNYFDSTVMHPLLMVAFNSFLAYLAYCRSAGVDFSPIDSVLRWFPYRFSHRRIHD